MTFLVICCHCCLHVDPALLHIQVKIHQTAPFFHAINIHVQKTNMPLRCHKYATYANYFMNTYETTMLVYIPHMNSMQSTMSTQAVVYKHFTLMI